MNSRSLQGFLIRNFLLVLAFVAIAETVVTYFMNQYYLPVIRGWFYKDIDIKSVLNSREMAFLLIILIIQLMISGIRSMMPAPVQAIFDRLLEGVNQITLRTLPKETLAYTTVHMSKMEALALFICLIVAAVLLLFPYVVAAIVYAKVVVEEIRIFEAKRDEEKKEFDQRRNLMLSDIAHDLRTPITTVCGYAQALSDGMIEDEEKKQEYLLAIQNKSARVSDLISLLFEYVKLDSDGFTLEKEELELAELLRENAALIYSDLEEAGMNFDIDIPEEQFLITGDRVQLSRVITNLLVNAQRHNDAGTTITLALKQRAGMLLVIVADTGDKIPEEIGEHLFEPFSKGDRSRKSGGGSGLGLSIARKVVEMHGWNLILKQPYGSYTKSFVITIPQK